MKIRSTGGATAIAFTSVLLGTLIQAVPGNTSPSIVLAEDEHSSTMGQKLDDSVITTKVKAALLKPDNGVSGMAIDVTTNNGEVQLSGFVDSTEQAQTAEKIAEGVGGVKLVRNDLHVKGQ